MNRPDLVILQRIMVFEVIKIIMILMGWQTLPSLCLSPSGLSFSSRCLAGQEDAIINNNTNMLDRLLPDVPIPERICFMS